MAVLGAGTTFSIEDSGTPGTYIQIPGIVSFGEVGAEAPLVDVSPIDQISNVYISGAKEGKELAIVGNLEKADADQALLRTAAKARETHNFQIAYTDGTTATFALTLRGYSVSGPERASAIQFSIPAKISGDITWVEA